MRKLNIRITYLPNFKGEIGYAHPGDAGLDLTAGIDQAWLAEYGAVIKVPTGVALEIPAGYEGQIRARSGLAADGLGIVNGVGTIDCGYRGEIFMLLINFNKRRTFTINPGDRICQIIFAEVCQAVLEEVETLNTSDRHVAGFGSTGI